MRPKLLGLGFCVRDGRDAHHLGPRNGFRGFAMLGCGEIGTWTKAHLDGVRLPHYPWESGVGEKHV
jgi:hypothetical protein